MAHFCFKSVYLALNRFLSALYLSISSLQTDRQTRQTNRQRLCLQMQANARVTIIQQLTGPLQIVDAVKDLLSSSFSKFNRTRLPLLLLGLIQLREREERQK